jgi:hypothetical protein
MIFNSFNKLIKINFKKIYFLIKNILKTIMMMT